VLNGVLVVAASGRGAARRKPVDAVVGGTQDRLARVLMTLCSLVGPGAAAMSHAIGSGDAAADRRRRRLGYDHSAALTLVVLPVTYYWADLAAEGAARRF